MSERSSSARELAKQSGITFVGNVASKAIKFGFVVAVTRLIDPTEYGLYTLALTVVLFLESVSNLNVHSALDYFVPRHLSNDDRREARSVVHTVVAVTLLTSPVAAVGLFVFSDAIAAVFDEPRLARVLAVFALAVPFLAIRNVFQSLFEGLKDMRYRVLIDDLTYPSARLVLAVLLVLLGEGLFGLVWGHVAAAVLAVLVGVVLVVRRVPWVVGRGTSGRSLRSVLSYSLPLAFAGVITSTVGQIDFFVIGRFAEADQVGFYRVAFLLAGNVLIFQASLQPVFKPMIAETLDDPVALQFRYQIATRWATMFSLPAALVLILAPGTYLALFFTSQYAVATGTLAVLVTGYVLTVSMGPVAKMLEATGNTRILFLDSALLLGTNAILDVILVQRIGILGAAIGTVVAHTLTNVVALAQVYYLHGVHPFSFTTVRTWLLFVPATAIGVAVVAIEPDGLVRVALLPTLVSITYAAAMARAGAFTEQDRQIAERIDERLGVRLLTRLVAG